MSDNYLMLCTTMLNRVLDEVEASVVLFIEPSVSKQLFPIHNPAEVCYALLTIWSIFSFICDHKMERMKSILSILTTLL